MEEIVKLLKELNYTISSCESITGGLFAKNVTDISSSSLVFKGGIIAYNNDIKINIVKVDSELIKEFGSISSDCALDMARKIKKMFKTDIGISFTGNAGPTNIEDKPIGLVYIAIVFKNEKDFLVQELNLTGNRNKIRQKALNQAQLILKEKLIKNKKESL